MDFFFIGDSELVTAFRFVGIAGQSVHNPDEARVAFLKITEGYDEFGTILPGHEGCRVLIITEEAADWLGELLVNWQLSDRYPLIVEVPALMGRIAGRKTLVDSIREAIGIRV